MNTRRPKGFHLYYVRDRGNYRIGRSDWPNDVFNVCTYEQYLQVCKGCNLVYIEIVDLTDDDC